MLNIFVLKLMLVGIVAGLFFLATNLFCWHSFKQESGQFALLDTLFYLLSFITLIGAFLYFVFNLSNFIITGIIIAIVVISLYRVREKTFDFNVKMVMTKVGTIFNVSSILYLILIISFFIILFFSRTTEAIVSPWQVLPIALFIVYFLATVVLVLGIIKQNLSVIFLGIHFVATFAVATIVYKLGYGYDPFIHQVTEEYIAKYGVIHPKPFYYLGQYSLVIFFTKLFNVSVVFIDRILILALTLIFLPSYIYRFVLRINNNEVFAKLSTLAILIIPFEFLINTTPFNLSVLFTILSVFLIAIYSLDNQKKYLYLSALATFMTVCFHALAGIPVMILFFGACVIKERKLLRIVFIGLSFLAIPFAFIINAFFNKQHLVFTSLIDLFDKIKAISIDLLYYNNYHFPIRDIIYTYLFNWKLIYILVAVIGLIVLFKRSKRMSLFLIVTISTAINYLLVKYLFVFKDLIEYERNDFADRLAYLYLLFLLPYFVIGIQLIIQKIALSKRKTIYVFCILLLSGLVTIGFYADYPRKDDFVASHGYSMSNSDFEIVELIDQDANGASYVVLANQTTSVAAMKTFGFKNYYNDIYFYPLPTGDILYNYYLAMTEKPDLEIINQVKKITNVEKVYFAISDYWSNAPGIIDLSKSLAKANFQSSDQKIRVFQY